MRRRKTRAEAPGTPAGRRGAGRRRGATRAGAAPKPEKRLEKRRAAGPRAVGPLLVRLALPALGKRGFAEAAILTDWAEIVGEDLARHSAPERIVFPRGKRRGGTLKLRVEGALAVELQHLAPSILERINGYFGFRAVERLALLQGPVPPPRRRKPEASRATAREEPAALAKELARVKDGRLKRALGALGAAIRRRDEDEGKPG